MPSIKCTCVRCPYHNPTAIMGHSIHNVDISKPLSRTTPHTLSVICPKQWKLGFIREENTSPMCQMPSNVSICPLKSVTMMNCSQVETLMRTTSMQMSFPEMVSDSLCRNSLFMQTNCWSSCPGGGFKTFLEGNMLDVEVLGWCGYTWSAVWGRLDVLPNCLKHLWRRLMVEKWTFNSWATALVDIPAVSMPIACTLKTCGIVLCDKTEHFRVVFYYIYWSFVYIENVLDLWVQLMKNGSKNKSVELYFCSVYVSGSYVADADAPVRGLTCDLQYYHLLGVILITLLQPILFGS